MCIDRYMDVWKDMRLEMRTDKCIDRCIDTCYRYDGLGHIEASTNDADCVHRHVCQHVCGRVCGHVYGHVYRHMAREFAHRQLEAYRPTPRPTFWLFTIDVSRIICPRQLQAYRTRWVPKSADTFVYLLLTV